MKPEASRVFNSAPTPGSVAEQLRLRKQLLSEVVTRGRELRARNADAAVDSAIDAGSAATSLVRAVAAVVERLPRSGAVTMNWDEALRLVQLDKPSAERLRELQDELRKANILFAFGSHVVSFARDAG